MYWALKDFNGSNAGLDSFYNKNNLNESHDVNVMECQGMEGWKWIALIQIFFY